MRWIILLLLSCFIVVAGCDDSPSTNDNNPGAGTDVGFNMGEDAVADADDVDAHNSDAAPNQSDTPKIPDDIDESPTCSTNAECTGSRGVCDPMSQLCVDCLFDSQCADGGRCIDRACKTEGTCESNLECTSVAGKPVCNHALRECVASCTNSLDCEQGDICDPARKQCVQCASNLDCSTGERCVDSQCEAYLACQSDNQCTPHGLLCNVERGACNECENDASCPNAYHCTEGRCVVDRCEVNAMRCAGNSVEKCVVGKRFEVVKSCQAPQICINEGNVASCASCTDNSHCAAGFECNQGVCEVQTCTANNNCATGFECNQGVCKRPVAQSCATAIAGARITGTTEYKAELHAQPLATIEFDLTFALADTTLNYEWTLLTRPTNSQTRLTPNTTVAQPKLWLDLAGDYEIELIVYDAKGIQLCAPFTVKVHAVPSQEIHIQLTWFAPTVPDPKSGNGTDMDLHYRHQQATKWNDRVYTVFWSNRNSSSSWGSTPALSNKATLDIDDLWGATTENINHVQPMDGSYEIGVHYYADNGKGRANANVRIYVHGILKHEFLDKQMQNKQFWSVGVLQWPGKNLIEIDQIVCDTTLPGFSIGGCRP